MKVQIETRPNIFVAGRDSIDLRDIDLEKPGNRKWLMSHIRWAADHDRVVSIAPKH